MECPDQQCDPKVEVGALFRATREAQQLTQEQLADLAAVSRSTISSIECGKILPSLTDMVALCQTLYTDPRVIIERLEVPPAISESLVTLSSEQQLNCAARYFWNGDFPRALLIFDALLREDTSHADPDDDKNRRRRSDLQIKRATTLRRLEKPHAAQEAADQALVLAEGFPEEQAKAYMVLATLYQQRGLLPQANDFISRAMEFSRTCAPHVQSLILIENGKILYRSKKFIEARKAYLQARQLLLGDLEDLENRSHLAQLTENESRRQMSNRHHLIQVEGNIGDCLIGLGNGAKGRARFVNAIKLAQKCDLPEKEALWLVALARAVFDDGDYDKAHRYCEEALRIARPRSFKLTIFRAEWIQHRIRNLRGSPTLDNRRLGRLRKIFHAVQHHRFVAEVNEFEEAGLANGQES